MVDAYTHGVKDGTLALNQRDGSIPYFKHKDTRLAAAADSETSTRHRYREILANVIGSAGRK
jgi:hypothetical protein